MILREEYLEALDIVIKYREQCKNDITDIDNVQSSLTLFKDVASPRLYSTVKTTLMIPWKDELTVSELRLSVIEVGIEKFKSIRGFGDKTFDELKKIVYNL